MAGFRKRTYAGFKRKRAGLGVRPFKRRKISYRRKSNTLTSQAGYGNIMPYKSRRVPRRRWNRMLYNSTTQKTHYRSVGATSGTATTTLLNTTLQINTVQAMDNGIGAFWTAAGGLLAVDPGVAPPTFKDDIIVRGGKIGISMYNDSTTDPVEITVYLIKNAPRMTLANMPANPNVGWDPTTVSEFYKDIGVVVYKRRFLLEANAVGECEYRLPVLKVDQEAWTTDQQRYLWITAVRDFDPAVQNTIRFVSYFNLSCTGDALT